VLPSDVLINMIGLSDWFRNHISWINPPTWYISVLLLCYAIYFGCILLAKRVKISPNIFYLCIVFVGVGIRSFSISLPLLRDETGRGYIAFFWGLLIANAYNTKNAKKNIIILECLSAISIVLTVVFYFWYCHLNAASVDEYQYNDYYWIVYIFYPSILILLNSNMGRKLLDHKAISFLGQVSFDVYIWHYGLIGMLMSLNSYFRLNLDFNKPLLMIEFTTFVWIISIFSYLFIEKRVSHFFNKIFDFIFYFLLEYIPFS
jgi:peptidoglycan/LPS O-acetylase OafA/YrhL